MTISTLDTRTREASQQAGVAALSLSRTSPGECLHPPAERERPAVTW